MEPAFFAIAVLLLAPLTVYAQLRIPRHSASSGQTIFTRTMLAMTGAGVGLVTARLFAADLPGAILIFLAGFCVVHFPAACILFIKQVRR
jgi:hypothetical protein